MEALGGLALVILILLGFYQLILYQDKEDTIFKENFKNLSRSKKFRLILEKKKPSGYTNGELKKIMREIQMDTEAQEEIKKSIEIEKIQEIYYKEYVQKRNYFAYHNLHIIKELHQIGIPINKLELNNIITLLCSNINAEDKIAELIENGILEINKKTMLYELTYLDKIFHPYELDENGEKKVILRLRDIANED